MPAGGAPGGGRGGGTPDHSINKLGVSMLSECLNECRILAQASLQSPAQSYGPVCTLAKRPPGSREVEKRGAVVAVKQDLSPEVP